MIELTSIKAIDSVNRDFLIHDQKKNIQNCYISPVPVCAIQFDSFTGKVT